MTDTRKAGSLILADLKLFNEAVVLFEQNIIGEIWTVFGNAMADWLTNNFWIGETDNMYWLQPNAWDRNQDGEGEYAWFLLESDEKSLNYEIANLCGLTSDSIDFVFGSKHSYFGKKKKWESFRKNISPSLIDKLSATGFSDKNNTGLFKLPIQLDNKKLALAYENEDYDEVFQPFIEALEKIKAAVPLFDELLALADNFEKENQPNP